ncbi:hypothetical protein SteCoe_17017 [Stentor coeruleus]|uniref:Uncharacterized protein n=1 Tax=Stentor coeruleus TaxID=5963 RepID=A0A1R2BZS2_9CILI|nr:hypothetical protein SteCoe_17017 [Stentor coeruleus]
MLQELESNTKSALEDWLIDMKSELALKVKHQERLHNFDFDNICPGHSHESKILWEKADKNFIGVGRIRSKQEFRIVNIKDFQIPKLKIKSEIEFQDEKYR